jgi:hypothetical protein
MPNARMLTTECFLIERQTRRTSVEVVLDSEDDFAAMFDEAWPIALAKLKEITEGRR